MWSIGGPDSQADSSNQSLLRDTLGKLGCERAEDFFEIAKSIESFRVKENYPEIHDPESIEHKLFSEFLDCPMDTGDPINSGQDSP